MLSRYKIYGIVSIPGGYHTRRVTLQQHRSVRGDRNKKNSHHKHHYHKSSLLQLQPSTGISNSATTLVTQSIMNIPADENTPSHCNDITPDADVPIALEEGTVPGCAEPVVDKFCLVSCASSVYFTLIKNLMNAQKSNGQPCNKKEAAEYAAYVLPKRI
jgi:hypothetical protein